MDYHSLTKAQRKLYLDAVSTTHWRRVTLRWFRRSNGDAVGSITNRFLGGSIKGDASRTPATVMECTLLDEDYDLDWSHGAHRKYRVQVVDSRFVPALDDWVDYEVFTGPVWQYDRTGAEVRLVAEGPEMEALGSVRKADSWKAKTKATTVIRELLERAGIEDKRIPKRKAKLPRDVTVGVKVGKDHDKKKDGYQGPIRQKFRVRHEDTYFAPASRIADAIDCDLFGNGSGAIVMARKKDNPSHRLDLRHLLGPVAEKPAQDGESPNVWIGFGHDPKGPKERVHDRVELPKRHPSSAHSQRLNGTPREVIVTVENEHWRKKKDVTKALKRLRDKGAREGTVYEVEALPVIPWLRPGAQVSVPVAGGRANARASQWDLPLGPGAEPLRIGATRRRGYSR